MLKRFKCGTCMKGTVLNIERELGRWSKSSRGFCCLLSSSVSQGRKFDMFLGFLDPLPLSPSVNLHLNLRCKLSTTILKPLSKLLLFLPSRLTLSSCTSWPSVKHTWVVLSHCKVIKRWAKQQGCSACSHVWLVSTRLLWLLTITSCPLIPWEERGRKGGIRNLEGLTDHWVRDTNPVVTLQQAEDRWEWQIRKRKCSCHCSINFKWRLWAWMDFGPAVLDVFPWWL